MDQLKNEILRILRNPQNELSAEILKITNGGLPVIILCSKTCKSIKEVKEAIKDLLKNDNIILNPIPYMKQNETFALKVKDLRFLLDYIDKEDAFIFDIVKIK